jgi:hypothetical protein
MIQQFYRSNDKALTDKIAQSTSFEDLELVPSEVARIMMSCEEKYCVDLGDELYPSIQSIIDAIMSVQTPAEDDKLPDPPPEIFIPETDAEGDEIVAKDMDEGDQDNTVVDEETSTEEATEEKPAEEGKSQEE